MKRPWSPLTAPFGCASMSVRGGGEFRLRPIHPKATVKLDSVTFAETNHPTSWNFSWHFDRYRGHFAIVSNDETVAESIRIQVAVAAIPLHARMPMVLDFAASVHVGRRDNVSGLLLVSMAWSGIQCQASKPQDYQLFDEITKILCDAIGDVFPDEGFAELVMSFVPPLLPYRLVPQR